MGSPPPSPVQSGHHDRGWGYLPLVAGLTSACLLWFSFPPVGWSWLAWLAPIPLIGLILSEHLTGSELASSPITANTLPAGETDAIHLPWLKHRLYTQLFLSGLIYWLATFYFIPIPHPALWLGWFVLSACMAIYTPLFAAISRTGVRKFGLPVLLVAPVAWTGLEWIRCNFATGMAMACLSHTQYRHPLLIQIADLSGAYTLTFAIVAVATALGLTILPKAWNGGRSISVGSRIAGGLAVVLMIAAIVGYGSWKIANLDHAAEENESGPSIQVAIIQSSIDVILRPPTQAESTERFNQYRDLTLAARQKYPDLDLILWPESSFPVEDLVSDYNDQLNVAYFAAAVSDIWQSVVGYPRVYEEPVPILVGATTFDPANEAMYNSAILISDPGIVTGRYFKIHRVMLGEYVPFADWFPFLNEVTPIGRGLTAGHEFTTVEIDGVRLAPSICFETTIPHLVRRQINTLASEAGGYQEPDAIVNLTNDGWFFGTSCLDLHLACNVFRSVEMRKPNLVCANTGLSAEIDAAGRLLQVGPRRNVDVIMAQVSPSQSGGVSLYRRIGDTFPMLFGFLCVGTILVSWRTRGSGFQP